MPADRVPAPGDVWRFRHLPKSRGVEVELVTDDGDVLYRYRRSLHQGALTLPDFVRNYTFVSAADEAGAA